MANYCIALGGNAYAHMDEDYKFILDLTGVGLLSTKMTQEEYGVLHQLVLRLITEPSNEVTLGLTEVPDNEFVVGVSHD